MSSSLLQSPSGRRAAVVLGAILLLFASLLLAGAAERQHRQEALRAAEVQARVLAQTASAALYFDDPVALSGHVAALRANPDIASVAIYDAQGRIRAASGATPMASGSEACAGAFAAAPVRQKDLALGEVRLCYRADTLGHRALRYIGPGMLVIMALMMFLVMGLDARSLARANQELRRQIVERARAEEALRQSQKMEALGRLTGGVAHDFNNMLSIVIGSLDLLQRRLGGQAADPRLDRLVTAAMEGARRAADLTQRLLAFSRRQPLNPAPADVARVLGETAEMLRRTLGESVVVETVTAGGLWRAHIDVPQLESALVNLGINARDAMPGGGRLTLEAANAYLDRAYAHTEPDLQPGQYVMIAVTDTGSGMPPEVMAQVFEPFFTTKPPGQGTGLGLSQVHGFIKQSGGHLRLYSEVGIGTTVKLYIPRSLDEPPTSTAAAVRPGGPQRREVTVLVVEDEAGVREFAVEALVTLGFDVIAASNGAEAMALLGPHPEIRLLLTDVVMPQTNGRVLAEAARRARPDLIVIFMTGYTPNAIVHNGVLDPGVRLLTKPFTVADLAAELDAALG